MLKLIGISGKPGSEKMVYAFKIIQELRFHGYKTHLVSLAEPLYKEFNEIADQIKLYERDADYILKRYNLGVNGLKLYNLLKENDLGEKSPLYGYSRRNEFVRKGLSILGSEIRREQDPDYFIKKLSESLPEGDFGGAD